MKINQFIAKIFIVTLIMGGSACSHKTETNKTLQNENSEISTKEQLKTPIFMEVDDLLKKSEELVNQEVKVQGVCTHLCEHGGTKLFLMGSTDAQSIRVEAGRLGSFDKKCVNSIVKISGILKEQRIDEEYLQKWPLEKKHHSGKKHIQGGECNTEMKSRGETAHTEKERIADFRKRIRERKAKEGKAYLTFYYIEAISYEIE